MTLELLLLIPASQQPNAVAHADKFVETIQGGWRIGPHTLRESSGLHCYFHFLTFISFLVRLGLGFSFCRPPNRKYCFIRSIIQWVSYTIVRVVEFGSHSHSRRQEKLRTVCHPAPSACPSVASLARQFMVRETVTVRVIGAA